MSKPMVGWWYARCCIEDLYQIRDEEELSELLAMDAEDEEMGEHPWTRYWPTLDAAIADPFIDTEGASQKTVDRLGLE